MAKKYSAEQGSVCLWKVLDLHDLYMLFGLIWIKFPIVAKEANFGFVQIGLDVAMYSFQ